MGYQMNPNSKLVFSTNSNELLTEEIVHERVKNSNQDLRIWLENKPGGKKATIVRGFKGSTKDLKRLGKTLKSHCHVGGTEKNGEILIQGNVREQVKRYLIEKGYNVKLSGG
jgi:translation initiation factor 1